jgi:RimJ/RimL family protein N-acetyltransferase
MRGLTLTTRRLLLRPWRYADREPFAAMSADPQVMAHFPARLTRAESDALVERFEQSFAKRGWGWFAIEQRATGQFLGVAGMAYVRFDAPFTPAVEIGWRLARPAWGRGIATEAATAVVTFAFDEVGLDEVVAIAVPANERSLAVMRRLGMTRDDSADFDHPLVSDTSLRGHVLYRLTAEQWARRSNPKP